VEVMSSDMVVHQEGSAKEQKGRGEEREGE
jgi:hypothetical protein